MKAVKIDVTKKEIYTFDIDERAQLASVYKELECSMIEQVAFIKPPTTDNKRHNDLYVDEEALVMPSVDGWFAFCPHDHNTGYVFKGHGAIIGFDGKESWCDHSVNIDRLKMVVRFLSEEDLKTFNVLN